MDMCMLIIFAFFMLFVIWLLVVFCNGDNNQKESLNGNYVIEYDDEPNDGNGVDENLEVYRGSGPWRRWPIRYTRRPWNTYNWLNNTRINTYPGTFYTSTFLQPTLRFLVRIGPKSGLNPFMNQGYDKGFMLNGISGGRLDLYRGNTYEFDVFTSRDTANNTQEDEPFFFTTNPEGGSNTDNVFDINPVRNGVVRITIGYDTPSQFYYQSTNHKYVGGYVFVH